MNVSVQVGDKISIVTFEFDNLPEVKLTGVTYKGISEEEQIRAVISDTQLHEKLFRDMVNPN